MAAILKHFYLHTKKIFTLMLYNSYIVLCLSFERNEYNGIETLFKESIDGKPRVTRCKKIISAVFQHFLTFQREVTCKTPNILFKYFPFIYFFFLISPSNIFFNAQSLLHMN